MTCTYPREQLALYVNGDATREEHKAAREHLSSCGDCQEIVAQYEALAAQTAGALKDVRPVRRRNPRLASRRWRPVAVTAAVAASLALALLITTRVPAVAAMVEKVFPWLTVAEMDQKATEEHIEQLNHPVTNGGPMESYKTMAEAEAAWGGKIPQPTALPPGMELAAINMSRWDSGGHVLLWYYNAAEAWHLMVNLYANTPEVEKVPEGASSRVVINGAPAVAIRGVWIRPAADKPVEWQPDGGLRLIFQLDQLQAHVDALEQPPSFTMDDLIKIAESIH